MMPWRDAPEWGIIPLSECRMTVSENESARLRIRLRFFEDLKLEDVLDYLHSKKVPKRFWPERLELIDRIPHTGSGKVKKYLLKEELEKRLKG